jgi:hypothetical protein
VFPAIVFILYLAVADPALLRSPRRWLSPVAAFALGLSVFIYLPLRGPLQGAEDLATLSGFLNHVSARGFRGDMFALNLLDRLVLLPTLLRFQFNLVLLCGMLTGAVCLLWRDRKMALLLIGSFLVHTAVTLTYDAPQTVEYEMPAYVSMALLMAVPFGLIPGLRPQTRGTQHFWVHCVYPLCLAILLIAGAVNLASRSPSYGTLSRSPDAREYAAAVLREAPSGAVVLSNWHWFNPLRYLQQIEALRPDVTVEYVAPGAEPLAKTWVRRIDERIHQRPVIAVRYFEHAYSALPYRFEPLGEAFLVRRELRSEAPSKLIPLDITLGEQIELLGYQLVSNGSEPGRPLVMVLAWSPIIPPTSDIAIFTQLIGPDGRLWSAVEDPLHAPERLTVGEVVVDRLVIYPLLHASPGDYDLVVGAYSPRERFTTAEGSDAVRLERVRLHPSTTRPVTRHPCFARFVGGPTLIGTDYDIGLDGRVRVYLHWMGPGRAADLHLTGDDDAMLIRSRVPALERGQYATVTVDRPGIPTRLAVLGGEGPRRRNLLFGGALRLPRPRPAERYVPFGDAMVLTGFNGPSGKLDGGTEVTLRLRFCGQRPVERDYIVSTALTGLNADGTWAWRESHDTVPALGAVPTLKWIHASCILDPHHMTIPDDAPVVPTVGSLVVYDHFTQRTLPPLDERLEPAVELSLWNVPVP